MTANLLPPENTALHDYEITYADERVPFSGAATETHVVKQSKSLKNALASFHRAVPRHGQIMRVRKITNAKL